MIDAGDNYLPYVTFVPVTYLVVFLAALTGVAYSVNSLLETFSQSAGKMDKKQIDGRMRKKVSFLENVMPVKHMLKDARQSNTSTEYSEHPLPYDETCDHLLRPHGQVVQTGLQVRQARVQFKIQHSRSQNNLETVENQPQGGMKGVKSVKDCVIVPEHTTKMFEISTKKLSNFKFPKKKHPDLTYSATKYESKKNSKVPDSVESRRAPILSTQCTEKSHENLFDRDVLDQFRESVVDLQSKGFVMGKEEARHQSEKIRENNHFLSFSSSIYSLFRSPPLSHLNLSSPKQDTLDDTSSIIFGLGDLNELREAESILSFDGDLQKIPYYRQLILHSDEMPLQSTLL